MPHRDTDEKGVPKRMNNAREAALAWALTDAAKSLMQSNTRAWVCAKIGAGEFTSAILDLLSMLSRNGTQIPAGLASQLDDWVSGYSGSEAEPALREMVSRIGVVGNAKIVS
jgi:hypothetical protein